MAIASQTSSTIIFEPQGSASGAVASDRPNGIAYHELELFIWKLRETVTNLSAHIEAPRIEGPGANVALFH